VSIGRSFPKEKALREKKPQAGETQNCEAFHPSTAGHQALRKTPIRDCMDCLQRRKLQILPEASRGIGPLIYGPPNSPGKGQNVSKTSSEIYRNN